LAHVSGSSLTRCLVDFAPVAGAKGYDVWASPYADGRGALRLGKGWTGPGQLLTGLRARVDFYLFVTLPGQGRQDLEAVESVQDQSRGHASDEVEGACHPER